MPKEMVCKGKGKLVICNLQATPLDGIAALRISGMCDKIMIKLMEFLGLEIPKFRLERRIQVSRVNGSINIKGIDSDGTPYVIFKCLKVETDKCWKFT